MMVNRKSTPIFLVLLSVLMLTGIGLVMISSTTAASSDPSAKVKLQLIWFIAGLLIFGVVGWVDYKIWRRWTGLFFIGSVVLLILVFIPPFRHLVNGAYRWINFGAFKIQPSEFLRLSVMLLLAHGLAKNESKIRGWKWGFFWPLGVIFLPLILLKFEPDFGTMILLSVTTLVMMFIAGSRVWPLLGAGMAGALAYGAMLWALPERRARLLAFLHPEGHEQGKFYQIYQGILAFGSGGTQGLGLGNSRQKMGYVPEAITDSIFPIIGEELGFYITLTIVIAYAVILVCGIWIAMNSSDTFGMLLGFGFIFGIILQAIINIGSVTGLIPPKGMPLPFVSYGGSNLLISYIAIGFLVSIHRQSLRTQRYSGGIPIDDETPSI